MTRLAIERGNEVESGGRRFVITHILDFRDVMARDAETGEVERLPISDLKVPSGPLAELPVADLNELDGKDWAEARRRQVAIKSLLDIPRRPRSEVERVAKQFGVQASAIYRWMNAYRASGKLSVLLPRKPDGGRGRTRLNEDQESIIKIAIERFYLTSQHPSVRSTADEVARLCKAQGIEPPHRNTVRKRVLAISERKRLRRRGNSKLVSDRFTAKPGTFDEAQHPLAVVQIDHTKLDIILVDEDQRLPIGRPWITLAIDVYSRMIVGFVVSLDPPGATSTGLCLAHAILPKETWLAGLGVTNPWPCWGFPAKIHLDNAKEFHGEMLRRACEQYGIEIDFRPLGRPEFGGHVERMMGTLATALHELPGTTFSNPVQRGEYDSEEKSALTLRELEIMLAEFITGVYHRRMHDGIKMAPLKRWTTAILGDGGRLGIGVPARPIDEDRLRLDFMPYEERTIQTYGVRIDELHYYSDVLRPYIEPTSRKGKRQFIFRRDPRDVSVVYFWDPELQQYFSIPFSDTTRPSISLWELREIRRRLVEDGRRDIDEPAIFEAYERLRVQRENAQSQTKTARRMRERRSATNRAPKILTAAVPQTPVPDIPITAAVIEPFEIDDV